jgi:hypothetical protein
MIKLPKNNDMIYIIPENKDKPVKIVFEGLPCFIYKNIRCEYAQFIEEENFIYSLKCTKEKCIKK